MADLPPYLETETDDEILARMKSVIPSNLDTAEGSYLHDALAPASIELAQAKIDMGETLKRGFAETTFGEYLTKRADEHGVARQDAQEATGLVVFTGLNTTVIPAGTVVATAADDVTNTSSVEFETTDEVTIGVSLSAESSIVAKEGGVDGNVGVGTVNLLISSVSGVSSVTNEVATSGGLDLESDESLLERYLQKVRNPGTSGNVADYSNWAMEVPGVGAVAVVPVRDGNGTVSVAILDDAMESPSATIVRTVQDYIAPPWEIAKQEAEDLTLGGGGGTEDTTRADDSGTCMKFVTAGGPGTLRQSNVDNLLVHPVGGYALGGVWQARVAMLLDTVAGATKIADFGVYNITESAWCKTTNGGSTDAYVELIGTDFTTTFLEHVVDFYWNGVDVLEFRLSRTTGDAARTLWVDYLYYASKFSQDTGLGKAPIGATVSVEAAAEIAIDVAVSVTRDLDYHTDDLTTLIEANIATYLDSLVFRTSNDVKIVRIGQALLDTEGVDDYDVSTLEINGGTANIVIGAQQYAKKGTVTLTWLN